MRRSRLLSTQLSINDIMIAPRTQKKNEADTQDRKNMSQSSIPAITPQNELFKGIAFKKLGSLDTSESEDSPNGESFRSQPGRCIESQLQCEKLRIKMQKNQKIEKQIKRLDPNRHLWQKKDEKTQFRVSTLRHALEVQSRNAKNNILRLSTIINPKNK